MKSLALIVLAAIFIGLAGAAAVATPESEACAVCTQLLVCPKCPAGYYCQENDCSCTARCVKGIPPK
ncbi:hypothetical protein EMPS_07481 [Entomortierella parvispora]|uniref:Uncharacterized protein n=1 Tax=Entomortierella parvispora TaxID=205924 RepID=A0A9P3HF00_9FUNG|nr:hypothetical protein EMPS_07481 [Entomortierella parvispora]